MKLVKSLEVSFEFFPPKTVEGQEQLYHAALNLAKASPHFFSVTFGAGGSTRTGTIETVNMLQNNTAIQVAPHLSCISSNRDEIIDLLHIYRSMNIRRLIALRGDLPTGATPAGEFKYANELVKCIRELSGDYFHIEVAAYPEIHPQAENAYHDIMNLKKKYEAGANGAITQYFFNVDAYFYLLDDCEKYGIHMPITPGIMPITHYNRLLRFSENCGAEIPRWIRKRLEVYGDDHESIQKFATEIIFDLCERLIAGGAPGLHFYTLNRSEASTQLVRSLGLMEEAKQELEVPLVDKF